MSFRVTDFWQSLLYGMYHALEYSRAHSTSALASILCNFFSVFLMVVWLPLCDPLWPVARMTFAENTFFPFAKPEKEMR